MAGQIETCRSREGVVGCEIVEHDSTWSISEAVLIGIGGGALLLTLLFVSLRSIKKSQLVLVLNAFQLREVATLISIVGAVLTLGGLLYAIRRRSRGGWWKAIQWNTGTYVTKSIIAGAGIALSWSIGLTTFRGHPASLGGRAVALSIALYIITDVFISPLVEEIYYRGILFIALAKRLGPLVSITVVTILFDVVHVGHMLLVLPAAVALGVARLKTKSVASCFALHASYNLVLLICQLVRVR